MKPAGYPRLLGAGRYLPRSVIGVEQAIGAGECQASDVTKSGFRSILSETALYPADMALCAARSCIGQRNLDPLRWLFYSYIHYQGQPRFWQPASYIQHALGLPQALAMSCVQGCNGSMLALKLACRLLRGEQQGQALCLAADRFNTTGLQRWRADYSIAYGDGAAAALVGYGEDAVADIRAIESIAAPELEALHRRAAPATEGSFDPDNVRACKKRYLEEHGSTALQEATRRSLALLWQRIAHQTGISRADIGYLVLPQLGRQLLEENYLPALDLPRAQVDIDAGLGLGHLGCADQLVGLIPLLNDRRARGELVLLVGGGAGFNWTLCLMELC